MTDLPNVFEPLDPPTGIVRVQWPARPSPSAVASLATPSAASLNTSLTSPEHGRDGQGLAVDEYPGAGLGAAEAGEQIVIWLCGEVDGEISGALEKVLREVEGFLHRDGDDDAAAVVKTSVPAHEDAAGAARTVGVAATSPRVRIMVDVAAVTFMDSAGASFLGRLTRIVRVYVRRAAARGWAEPGADSGLGPRVSPGVVEPLGEQQLARDVLRVRHATGAVRFLLEVTHLQDVLTVED